jgi:hypothetical protein
LSEIFIAAEIGGQPPLQMKSSCAAQRLVPIFPNRFEPATAKHGGDFGWGTFVADFKLTRSKLIFAILVFRCDDATAYRLM